ncbi:hypothetical protein FHS60_001236 [Alloprevotella rava]|uniref:Uncharacterized protein n=1 Tax=Alloprevotella rava TaxID=671218 RepID=A0A7W5UN83_9BACT|nr:hypothetical protein [Alloprevotella rava]
MGFMIKAIENRESFTTFPIFIIAISNFAYFPHYHIKKLRKYFDK